MAQYGSKKIDDVFNLYCDIVKGIKSTLSNEQLNILYRQADGKAHNFDFSFKPSIQEITDVKAKLWVSVIPNYYNGIQYMCIEFEDPYIPEWKEKELKALERVKYEYSWIKNDNIDFKILYKIHRYLFEDEEDLLDSIISDIEYLYCFECNGKKIDKMNLKSTTKVKNKNAMAKYKFIYDDEEVCKGLDEAYDFISTYYADFEYAKSTFIKKGKWKEYFIKS